MILKKALMEKFREALAAVLPIVVLVLILSMTAGPIPSGVMLSFLLGAVMLVAGMMFFSVGAEVAMEPMGKMVGARVTQTRNLHLILGLGFLLGVLITVSEPDLQVLAQQVQSIPNLVLILSVALGVGGFLVLSLVRILYRISLRTLLAGLYLLVLVLMMIFRPKGLLGSYDFSMSRMLESILNRLFGGKTKNEEGGANNG